MDKTKCLGETKALISTLTELKTEPTGQTPKVEAITIKGKEPEPKELKDKEPTGKAGRANTSDGKVKSSSGKDRNKGELDFTGIPDILKPTARILMTLSGRTSLTERDIELLKLLLERHVPTRINREIESKAEYFRRTGKPAGCLTASYIYACLKNQRSFWPGGKLAAQKKQGKGRTKKARKSNEKGTQSKEKSISEGGMSELSGKPEPVKLTMTVAEAEKVISEHKAEKRPEVEIPAALQEMYEQINDFVASHEEPMTVEDYVAMQVKSLAADMTCEELEELLSKYRHGNIQTQIHMREAFVIDKACAKCSNPDQCKFACEKAMHGGPKRPSIKVAELTDGQKVITADAGVVIPCKHSNTQKSVDVEYESRVKKSGLTPKQERQTFDTYEHDKAGAEAVVAKAQAMLASKDKRNLILAGRTGTGKTHLAVAIALEAMQAGLDAVVISVAEMLDGIIESARNYQNTSELVKKYKTVSCLVLDDWGKENTTQAKMKYLYEIIGYRYRHELQTITTTNAYTMEGLKDKWNGDKIEPLVSRLLENGEW